MCNKPRVHACQQCGTGFTDRKRKYCSDDCYRAAALRRRRLPQASKECPRCGQEFQSNKRKYCSFACYYETSLERTANRNKENVDEFLKAKDMKNTNDVDVVNLVAEKFTTNAFKCALFDSPPTPTWEQMRDKANDLEQQVRRLERENERAWKVVDALIEKQQGDE